MPQSVIAVANERVSFAKAAGWAGLGSGERERGMKVTCPVCGDPGAMRVYPDHGWCFSERRYYTAVTLLAEKWRMEPEDAATEALKKTGYVLPDYTDSWELAQREPEPARDDLAAALQLWCEAQCPDWRLTRQYDKPVAGKLSQCLGLLPLVVTEADCDKWLVRCKEVMGKALSLDLAK